MSKTTDLIKKKLKRYKAKEAAEKEKVLRAESHIAKQNERTFRKADRIEKMEDGHSPLPSGKARHDKYYEERNQRSRSRKNLSKHHAREYFDEDIPF